MARARSTFPDSRGGPGNALGVQPKEVFVGPDLLALQYKNSPRKAGLLLRGWKPDAVGMSRILTYLYKLQVFSDYREASSEDEADQADRALGIESRHDGNSKIRRILWIAALPPREASEALILSSVGAFSWRICSSAALEGLPGQESWTVEMALGQLPKVVKAARRQARIQQADRGMLHLGPENEKLAAQLVSESFDQCPEPVFTAVVLAFEAPWQHRGWMINALVDIYGLDHGVALFRRVLEGHRLSKDDFEAFWSGFGRNGIFETMLEKTWPDTVPVQAWDAFSVSFDVNLGNERWAKHLKLPKRLAELPERIDVSRVTTFFGHFREDSDLWIAAVADVMGSEMRLRRDYFTYQVIRTGIGSRDRAAEHFRAMADCLAAPLAIIPLVVFFDAQLRSEEDLTTRFGYNWGTLPRRAPDVFEDACQTLLQCEIWDLSTDQIAELAARIAAGPVPDRLDLAKSEDWPATRNKILRKVMLGLTKPNPTGEKSPLSVKSRTGVWKPDADARAACVRKAVDLHPELVANGTGMGSVQGLAPPV